MIEVKRHVQARPEDVFSVLADGWLYASWVVGASRVRSVDANWPAIGSKIHHSFGVWPAVLNDTTEVLDHVENHRLVLKARGWPLGEATVYLELEEQDGGCLVRMQEDASNGPGKLVPQPIRQLGIAPRNVESLWRLQLIAEGHAANRDRR
jgi:hypothetical protein